MWIKASIFSPGYATLLEINRLRNATNTNWQAIGDSCLDD